MARNPAAGIGCETAEVRLACYTAGMTLEDEMKGYRERWAAVEAAVAEERAAATIAER